MACRCRMWPVQNVTDETQFSSLQCVGVSVDAHGIVSRPHSPRSRLYHSAHLSARPVSCKDISSPALTCLHISVHLEIFHICRPACLSLPASIHHTTHHFIHIFLYSLIYVITSPHSESLPYILVCHATTLQQSHLGLRVTLTDICDYVLTLYNQQINKSRK